MMEQSNCSESKRTKPSALGDAFRTALSQIDTATFRAVAILGARARPLILVKSMLVSATQGYQTFLTLS